MGRFLAGVGAALLLVAAGFFIWSGRAEDEQGIPPAPPPSLTPYRQPLQQPPAASDKTREEKRFARYDKDEDGRITRAEMMDSRRKSWAKLDTNGDGRLSFEEWAISTSDKFAKADADNNGSLTPAEFLTTRRETRPKPKCGC